VLLVGVVGIVIYAEMAGLVDTGQGWARSYSSPTRPGSRPPARAPVPASSHDDGRTTTPAAWTGLQSYWAPSSRLSGSFRGGRRQSVVTSEGSVFQAGSSPTDQGL
jgi:hypothetical protein